MSSSSTDCFDVAVVGAGPGGTAAAISLAEAGAKVLVVDKSRFPRDKCCGDGLTTGALRRLDLLGVELGTIESFAPMIELVVRSPSGRLAVIPLDRSEGIAAAVATRRDLDAALLARALDAGSQARLGVGVCGIEASTDVVELLLEDGSLVTAERVVAADGAWSTTRRLLEASSSVTSRSRVRSNWTAFRAYAEGVSEQASRALHVLFNKDVLPGYIWSFPLPNRMANIGVYLARDGTARGGGLRSAWEQARSDPYLVSLLGPQARLAAPARAWPVSATLDTSIAALGGAVLFCGDALGAADPFTGEGIAQALECGILAAQAIQSTSSPEAAAKEYGRLLERGLYLEHRIAEVFARAFRNPATSRLSVAGTGIHPFVARQVGRWLYEDYPRSAFFHRGGWRQIVRPEPLPFSSGPIAPHPGPI